MDIERKSSFLLKVAQTSSYDLVEEALAVMGVSEWSAAEKTKLFEVIAPHILSKVDNKKTFSSLNNIFGEWWDLKLGTATAGVNILKTIIQNKNFSFLPLLPDKAKDVFLSQSFSGKSFPLSWHVLENLRHIGFFRPSLKDIEEISHFFNLAKEHDKFPCAHFIRQKPLWDNFIDHGGDPDELVDGKPIKDHVWEGVAGTFYECDFEKWFEDNDKNIFEKKKDKYFNNISNGYSNLSEYVARIKSVSGWEDFRNDSGMTGILVGIKNRPEVFLKFQQKKYAPLMAVSDKNGLGVAYYLFTNNHTMGPIIKTLSSSPHLLSPNEKIGGLFMQLALTQKSFSATLSHSNAKRFPQEFFFDLGVQKEEIFLNILSSKTFNKKAAYGMANVAQGFPSLNISGPLAYVLGVCCWIAAKNNFTEESRKAQEDLAINLIERGCMSAREEDLDLINTLSSGADEFKVIAFKSSMAAALSEGNENFSKTKKM